LNRLQTSHLLLLATDLPQMTAEQLRKLWALSRPGGGVIPMIATNFEPACAIYPVEIATEANAALKSGHLSLQRLAGVLIKENRAIAYSLSKPEAELFHNVNMPADLPDDAGFR
jgi:molybdopterin-guanine dinucleotide biosynthesis protein A